MIIKSFFTAAALLFAAGTMSADAEAKTRVHIGIGVGDPWYDNDCDYSLLRYGCARRHFGYGYYYGPPRYYYRPHRVIRYVDRMSCSEARMTLRDRGFRNVSARDCNGRFYSFNATRKGRGYRVTVNSVTGDISRTRR
jgi:hypothetical protein